MKKRIVTQQNVRKGLRVIPGRDWIYENQASNSKFGTIIEDPDYPSEDGWFIVDWENNSSQNYRVGEDESEECDLYFYEEELIKPEFIGAVKKHFKVNKIESVTREMLEEANLQEYLL